MSWKELFFSIFLVFVLVGCSANKPAPISDRSSNNVVSKPQTQGYTYSEVNPLTAKSSPIATSKITVQKTPPKEVKSEVKPEAKKEVSPVDPGFRISKPSSAPIIESFNGTTSKGIDFGGKMGDPIIASSDGKVIYSGNNLRTYGNLVIINHNNSYVTVYANNKNLLVKEGDTVKRGQKIAEMGNSESDKVKLHFELRKNSKPIDPSTYFSDL